MARILLSYTTSKILELGIFMLIVFHVSAHVIPDELAKLSTITLLVTYSSYVNFGLNSSLLKFSSKTERYADKFQASHSLAVVFQGAVLFILSIVFDIDYIEYLLFFNFVRVAVQSKLRASGEIYYLSLYNLLYISLFASSYMVFLYIGVGYIDSLKLSWSVSSGLLVSGYVAMNFRSTFKKLSFYHSKFLALLLRYGPSLMAFNFGVTLSLTSDRLLLNALTTESELIGLYQFADQLSMIPYLLVLTASYAVIKPLVVALSKRHISTKRLLFFFLATLILIALISLSYVILARYLVSIYIGQYVDSLNIFNFLLAHKLVLLVYVPLSIVAMAFNYEKLLNKFLYSALFPALTIQFLVVLYMPTLSIYLAPIMSFFIIIVAIMFFNRVVKVYQ